MKIKLLIFDLDGVLVDAKNIHYNALNKALGEKYSIDWQEHLSFYDGLKTYQKLEMLSKKKGLPTTLYEEIWEKKQNFTLEKLNQLKPNKDLKKLMRELVDEGYKISVCSNSIRKTVLTVLSKLGLIEYMDYIISNEDVKNSKPHPEMYWKAMSALSVTPEETVIVEDSPHGLLAAQRCGSECLRVKNPQEVTKEKLSIFLNKKNLNMNTKWQDKNLNVLIPMAGAGSRFEKAGYTFPKPLIEVNGEPMIQVVVNNLNMDSNHIFIAQKTHKEKYNLDSMLSLISPGCDIVEVDGLTEGAACTTLLAKDLINNDNPLIIANSDQFVEWNTSEFMYKMQEQDADAGILTKNPISNIATVGIYYWKKGSDYVKCAEQMIQKNIRHNNEFYVCPVFNQAIEEGLKVKTFDIKKMWGLGTPEDLKTFLER